MAFRRMQRGDSGLNPPWAGALCGMEVAMDDDKDRPVMNPGDQAPPGTPGTGENVCRTCKGSGRVGGTECPDCGGSGKVIEEIGGA